MAQDPNAVLPDSENKTRWSELEGEGFDQTWVKIAWNRWGTCFFYNLGFFGADVWFIHYKRTLAGYLLLSNSLSSTACDNNASISTLQSRITFSGFHEG